MWLRDPDGNIVNLSQPMPSQPDPERIVRAYFHRLLVDRDLSVRDELLACDYLDHDASDSSPRGPARRISYVSRVFDDYPDLRFATEELVAHDRLVALRARSSGTHRATGEPWRQLGLVSLRVDKYGQIAERWSVYT